MTFSWLAGGLDVRRQEGAEGQLQETNEGGGPHRPPRQLLVPEAGMDRRDTLYAAN